MSLREPQAEVKVSLEKLIKEIAHDLRNPLATARGFAQMIELSPDASPKTKSHAERIRQALDQINDFITKMTERSSGS